MLGENVYLLGHGTLEATSAQGALQNGLETRHTDLFSTVDGLSTLDDDPDAVAKNKPAIEDWPHLGAKRIVVIGVERFDPEDIPHRRYLQSIVQPKPESEHSPYGTNAVIDRRFVAGYFDATNNTFVRNPDFDPHYDPSLLETTINEDIRKELDRDPTENPLDRMLGSGAVKPATPQAPVPSKEPTHPDASDDIVW